MTNYEQLKKKICEALPRLMERQNGYAIQAPHWNMFSQSFDTDKYDYYTIFNGNVYTEYGTIICRADEIDKEFYQLDKCILGIEPALSDCLAYIKEILKKESSSLSMQELLAFWNLSQPLLKDQSEELIDYLLRL